jgi:hypothetical protein
MTEQPPSPSVFPPLSSWARAAAPGPRITAAGPPRAARGQDRLLCTWAGMGVRTARHQWDPHRREYRLYPYCYGDCGSRGGCRSGGPSPANPPVAGRRSTPYRRSAASSTGRPSGIHRRRPRRCPRGARSAADTSAGRGPRVGARARGSRRYRCSDCRDRTAPRLTCGSRRRGHLLCARGQRIRRPDRTDRRRRTPPSPRCSGMTRLTRSWLSSTFKLGVSRIFVSWFLSSSSQSRRPTHDGGTYSSLPFAATPWMTTSSATSPAWCRLPRGFASTASYSPGSWGRSPSTSTASSGTFLMLGLSG